MIRSAFALLLLPTCLQASPQLMDLVHPIAPFPALLLLVGLAGFLDQWSGSWQASRRIGIAGVVISALALVYRFSFSDQSELGDVLFSYGSDQTGLACFLLMAGGLAVLGSEPERLPRKRHYIRCLLALGLLLQGWKIFDANHPAIGISLLPLGGAALLGQGVLGWPAVRRIGIAGVAIITASLVQLHMMLDAVGAVSRYRLESVRIEVVCALLLAGGLAFLRPGEESYPSRRHALTFLLAAGILGLSWDLLGSNERYSWMVYNRARLDLAGATLPRLDDLFPPDPPTKVPPPRPSPSKNQSESNFLPPASRDALFLLIGAVALLYLVRRRRQLDPEGPALSPARFWFRVFAVAIILALAYRYLPYHFKQRPSTRRHEFGKFRAPARRRQGRVDPAFGNLQVVGMEEILREARSSQSGSVASTPPQSNGDL